MDKKGKNSIESLKQRYKKEDENRGEILLDVITKKAKGYVLEEITEEFVVDESGEMKLAKRKVIAKEIGPDLNCVKALEEITNQSKTRYENMTDEELKQEKERLLKLILQEEGEK